MAPKPRMPERDNSREAMNTRLSGDSQAISFEMVIGTDSGQIAVAPGYLQKHWTEGGRTYFHYKMDKRMRNFYCIVSARYETLRDRWSPPHDSLGGPVGLEIYYHKGHEYNLSRMMKAMKMSFSYFSKHFGPYQYRQMRILEFPRYSDNARSFPNTVPFSESIGFMLDIDNEKDVDITFYVTAHEISHQWWGHQVNPANVQGMAMITESLAQYSALMVMKQQYPEERVRQFLQLELNRYLRGRAGETKREMPLALVENQEYIRYGKGAVNFYALQDYISEDSVNLALSRFIRDWNSFDGLLRTDRYPTTADLLDYFREVTPDSMQYVISDLFEKITLFENKVNSAEYVKVSDKEYTVTLELASKKLSADTLGTETQATLNDWIDVGVYGEGENGKDKLIYLKKHRFVGEKKNLVITVKEEPKKSGHRPHPQAHRPQPGRQY